MPYILTITESLQLLVSALINTLKNALMRVVALEVRVMSVLIKKYIISIIFRNLLTV